MYTLDTSSTITAALDTTPTTTTTAPVVTVTYSDVQLSDGVVAARTAPATATVSVPVATPATVIVASPTSGAREVMNIAFRNPDTVAHTVTFGGAVDLIFTIPAGQTLFYGRDTWQLGATNVVALAGDVVGTTAASTLSASGVTAGTYTSTTVDAKGRVIAGTNPTTLAGYGITDAPHIESGTFTPVLKGSLTDPTGVTYGTQEGAYMKIGPWCIVHMWITWSAITAIGSGDFSVTLPIAPISYADTGAIRAYVDATVNVTSIQTRVLQGNARLCYPESPGGYVWSANTRSAGQFAGTLVYKWS